MLEYRQDLFECIKSPRNILSSNRDPQYWKLEKIDLDFKKLISIDGNCESYIKFMKSYNNDDNLSSQNNFMCGYEFGPHIDSTAYDGPITIHQNDNGCKIKNNTDNGCKKILFGDKKCENFGINLNKGCIMKLKGCSRKYYKHQSKQISMNGSLSSNWRTIKKEYLELLNIVPTVIHYD